MVPSETALEIVPLDMTRVMTLKATKAATGKERKLAAANPSAASRAIQQKMIPKPRA